MMVQLANGTTNTTLLVLAIVLPVVAAAIAAVAAIFIYRFIKGKKINEGKKSAEKLLQEAIANSQNIQREAKVKAQEEVLKQRQELEKQKLEEEKEIKQRRADLAVGENRVRQKEESLDRKEENVDRKLESLEQSKEQLKEYEQKLQAKEKQANEAVDKIHKELERVAKLTKKEAKDELVATIEKDAKIEAAKFVRASEQAAKEEADKKAKEIVAGAIQRCGVDHSSVAMVTIVPLPSDEIKGRIIGREGRNIRKLEAETGIDFVIDDTPETIVLSGFDPVRREIARVSLERLMADGRINQHSIETVVAKVKQELDEQMKEAGEAASFEAGVFGLNSELIKILGRLKFRTSYGQNVLKHSLEVAHLAGLMAAELGADVQTAKRGGLLHDIGKALDHETEGTHISIGVDLAKKYRESEAVIHCIAAHHNDIEPKTIEAILVQCADGISGGKPGARRESLDAYTKRLEKLEQIANAFKGVEKAFAIQAGREIRVIVKPEVVDDASTTFLAKDIAKQIEEQMQYPGQVKVNVIRETRSIDFAK